MLQFISKVAGRYLIKGDEARYIKELGEDYPVVIKFINGDRGMTALKNLHKFDDQIKEVWLPTESNWGNVMKHGMEFLENHTAAVVERLLHWF